MVGLNFWMVGRRICVKTSALKTRPHKKGLTIKSLLDTCRLPPVGNNCEGLFNELGRLKKVSKEENCKG
jgi:hypothetical protein